MSNFTDPITPEAAQALKSAGVELVIVQAIDPPAGYPSGKTRDQIQVCLDAGLAVDAYVWLWFSLGTDDILHKLALLDGLNVRELWLDVEDTAAINYDQATCEAKVQAALDACDLYRGGHTGVYSGRWYWADRRYMGNATAFADRELWTAQYDGIPDVDVFTPYGGWTQCAIKQFRGTSSLAGIGGIDLNVVREKEAPPMAQPSPIDSGLISAVAYISDDLGDKLLDQANQLEARARDLRAIAGEMQRVRVEQVGPRP